MAKKVVTNTSDNPDALTKNRYNQVNQMTPEEYYRNNIKDAIIKNNGLDSNTQILPQTPNLFQTYKNVDQDFINGNGNGQYTIGPDGKNHAASCISTGCSVLHQAGDNFTGDLNNHGEGYLGNQTAYNALIKDPNRKLVKGSDVLKYGDLFQFNKKDGKGIETPVHAGIYMGENDEENIPTPYSRLKTNQQKVIRLFENNGGGSANITVFPEDPQGYKLKEGEKLSHELNYQGIKNLLNGKPTGDYSSAHAFQRTKFDDIEKQRQLELNNLKNNLLSKQSSLASASITK